MCTIVHNVRHLAKYRAAAADAYTQRKDTCTTDWCERYFKYSKS